MELKNSSPLGKGNWHPAGSVTDSELLSSIQSYRRRVTSAYRSVKPTELSTGIIGAPFHVSPKVDGELWFMVLEAGEVTLVSTNGKAITGDIPLLAEAKAAAAKVTTRAVMAGELFAASSGKGRPRVGDVASALAGGAKAPVERLGFMAFDLVEGLLPEAPQQLPYAQRLEAIAGLLASGKRVKAIKTDTVESISALPALFADIVEGGKAEGLVVRSALGSIYKVKPEFSIDAIIIGYTARTEDPQAVRTLLLGLTREDGRIQIAGHCGNFGGDAERKALMQRLQPLQCTSGFRCPSRSGDLFTFVRPEVVAEINVTDLQPESSDGEPVRTMALQYEPDNGWKSISPMPSASWLHPVLVRLRDDKKPDAVDTRFAQILERCLVDQASSQVAEVQLPASQVLKRKVWTKTTKGKVAVRKLVAWKTNKADVDPSYPAFVVHWTDYSAGRGTPLDREVRTAPTEALMEEIAAKMVEDNIKKGWEEVA
jgi:hypothetical protein